MISTVPSSSTVFTPPTIAAAMVTALGDGPDCMWLDPCVGDGAFVAEVARIGVPPSRIRALDLSSVSGLSDRLAETERKTDFLAWAHDRSPSFHRVVMNPPYVALSRLGGEPRRRALSLLLSDGKPLPLKANYWCAFVVAATRLVLAGGSMAVVLPASWDFARYAGRVRDFVAESFGDVTVVRSATPLFPHVKEGSVVVVARRRGARPGSTKRVEVENAEDAAPILQQLPKVGHSGGSVVIPLFDAKRPTECRLADLVDIRIGAVTGDAHYFLLSEAERQELALPRAALRPVLTRSRHLDAAFLDSRRWKRLLEADERVWLFRPTTAVLEHPAVRRYLRKGREGLCNRAAYKIQARSPWYETPLPGRVDGFLSGMSHRLPFLVLRETPGLSATNTLYVARFKRNVGQQAKLALAIGMLSSTVRRELSLSARRYADGLLKFEPSDLGSVRVPIVERPGGRSTLARATALLVSGHEREAELLADDWIAGARE